MDNEERNTAPVETPAGADTAQDTAVNPQGGEAPELLAGKYSTPEELEQGYQALESKMGEMGSYKQTAEELSQQLDGLRRMSELQKLQGDQAPAKDTDQRMAELREEYNEGTIDEAEYDSRKTELLSEKLESQVLAKVTKAEQDRMEDAARRQFAEQNPDFIEMYRSGEIRQHMQQNPVLDSPVAAYYDLKTRKMQSTHQAELEAAKAEAAINARKQVQSGAAGAKQAETVLGESSAKLLDELNSQSGDMDKNDAMEAAANKALGIS